MSAAEFRDHVEVEEKPTTEPLGLAPDAVEVRRNAGLAAFVGAVASGVAIAYLARATNTGAPLDWVLAAVMGVLGIAHLAAFVDARTPLLVADTQGVRIRLGNTWRGLPWGALSRVEHRPRRGPLRDGRLVLVVRHPARLIEELDARGRRQSRLSQKLYGAPFAVPLALSTRVSGAGDDLTAALTALAGSEARIVVVQPEPEAEPDSEPEAAPLEPRARARARARAGSGRSSRVACGAIRARSSPTRSACWRGSCPAGRRTRVIWRRASPRKSPWSPARRPARSASRWPPRGPRCGATG